MAVRMNYENPQNCPKWAGSGYKMRFPWEEEGGCYGDVNDYKRSPSNWGVYSCSECGGKFLPLFTRWVDPDYWRLAARREWDFVSYHSPLRKVREDFKKREFERRERFSLESFGSGV